MRSGTTLMARYLGDALPGPTTALRETGITLVAHELLTVLEYNQREHEFGFRMPPGSPLRGELLCRVAGTAATLYRDRGHEEGRQLVDKQPYALGDAAAYYAHLYEVFPDVRIVATVRAPEPTVASMLRRTWGRGPWPRPALISPVPPYLTPEENLLGDRTADDRPVGPGPADGVRRWSLAKACLHYNRAVLGLAESPVARRGLILPYHRLGEPATKTRLEEFLGTALDGPIPFEPSGLEAEFTTAQREFIERETREAARLYAEWDEAAGAAAGRPRENGP